MTRYHAFCPDLVRNICSLPPVQVPGYPALRSIAVDREQSHIYSESPEHRCHPFIEKGVPTMINTGSVPANDIPCKTDTVPLRLARCPGVPPARPPPRYPRAPDRCASISINRSSNLFPNRSETKLRFAAGTINLVTAFAFSSGIKSCRIAMIGMVMTARDQGNDPQFAQRFWCNHPFRNPHVRLITPSILLRQ